MENKFLNKIISSHPLPIDQQKDNLRKELSEVLSKYSFINGSETPNHVLVEYVINCLENFDKMSKARDRWFNK